MKINMIAKAITASLIMVACGSNNFPDTTGESNMQPIVDNGDSMRPPVNNDDTTNPPENNNDTTNPPENNDSNNSKRFTLESKGNDKARLDTKTKLLWVASTDAILYAESMTTEDEDIASAKAHCEALDFFESQKWAVPSDVEGSKFIKETTIEKIPTVYRSKCKMMMGINTYNKRAVAIYVDNSIGIAGTTKTWEELLGKNDTQSYCVKCVKR